MALWPILHIPSNSGTMLDHIDFNKVLFLDIETVPQYTDYDQVPERMRMLWDEKAARLKERSGDASNVGDPLYDRAGIYAEFGKVICICIGIMADSTFRMKSFHGHDEQEVLSDFSKLLRQNLKGGDWFLCAHNGKEFDFPYLSRRMLIQGIDIPDMLQNAGKKPWEVKHLDTMELWKFGDFKSYTSLDLLTMVMGLPSPKDQISGADIHRVYYEEKDLDKIVEYCMKDTLAVAQILRRFKGMSFIEPSQVQIVI